MSPSLVEPVRTSLQGYYGGRVVVLRPAPLPASAYYAPRRRYKADRLLKFLAGPGYGAFDKVIGLTERDISTKKDAIPDWGVFGLGSMGGKACVVSTFRLRRGAGEAKVKERLIKVAVHEVGHTLGLPHCTTPGCVMADAKGTIASVDRDSAKLCPACARKIGLH